jgi:hypothetical protein
LNSGSGSGALVDHFLYNKKSKNVSRIKDGTMKYKIFILVYESKIIQESQARKKVARFI